MILTAWVKFSGAPSQDGGGTDLDTLAGHLADSVDTAVLGDMAEKRISALVYEPPPSTRASPKWASPKYRLFRVLAAGRLRCSSRLLASKYLSMACRCWRIKRAFSSQTTDMAVADIQEARCGRAGLYFAPGIRLPRGRSPLFAWDVSRCRRYRRMFRYISLCFRGSPR
jgi:hypothetical protein